MKRKSTTYFFHSTTISIFIYPKKDREKKDDQYWVSRDKFLNCTYIFWKIMGKVIGDFFSQLLTTYANLLVHNELYHLRFFFVSHWKDFFSFFVSLETKKKFVNFFCFRGGDFFFMFDISIMCFFSEWILQKKKILQKCVV